MASDSGTDKSKDLASESNSGKKLRALVVDDDIVVRQFTVALLKEANLQVEEVKDGGAAVRCFAQGKTYDIVLMDKDMPNMNGAQATALLRGMDVKCMIVGVSSHSDEKERREFMEAGLDDYVVKPLTKTRLMELLEDAGSHRVKFAPAY